MVFLRVKLIVYKRNYLKRPAEEADFVAGQTSRQRNRKQKKHL